MTGAPPKPSDCQKPLPGAHVIGFSDLLGEIELAISPRPPLNHVVRLPSATRRDSSILSTNVDNGRFRRSAKNTEAVASGLRPDARLDPLPQNLSRPFEQYESDFNCHHHLQPTLTANRQETISPNDELCGQPPETPGGAQIKQPKNI